MYRQISDEGPCVGARHQCRGHRNAERTGLQLSVLRFAQISETKSR
jgi:hypothetical protein